MSSPQHSRTPPPTFVTSTSLPQMLQRYFSPISETLIDPTSPYILTCQDYLGFVRMSVDAYNYSCTCERFDLFGSHHITNNQTVSPLQILNFIPTDIQTIKIMWNFNTYIFVGDRSDAPFFTPLPVDSLFEMFGVWRLQYKEFHQRRVYIPDQHLCIIWNIHY